jgi:hypothetical protein
MKEATLLMGEESLEWRGSIHSGGGSVGLEVVNPHLGGRVHVVSRLGKQRRNVAARALRLAVKKRFPSLRRVVKGIKRTLGAGMAS